MQIRVVLPHHSDLITTLKNAKKVLRENNEKVVAKELGRGFWETLVKPVDVPGVARVPVMKTAYFSVPRGMPMPPMVALFTKAGSSMTVSRPQVFDIDDLQPVMEGETGEWSYQWIRKPGKPLMVWSDSPTTARHTPAKCFLGVDGAHYMQAEWMEPSSGRRWSAENYRRITVPLASVRLVSWNAWSVMKYRHTSSAALQKALPDRLKVHRRDDGVILRSQRGQARVTAQEGLQAVHSVDDDSDFRDSDHEDGDSDGKSVSLDVPPPPPKRARRVGQP